MLRCRHVDGRGILNVAGRADLILDVCEVMAQWVVWYAAFAVLTYICINVMADGAVIFISNQIDPDLFKGMLTRSGRETLEF